jgi:predicted nucleic acid-binding protein
MSNERIQLVRPDRKLLKETYALSAKHGLSIYDSVFIALALQLKIELATFDSKQSTVLSEERQTRQINRLPQGETTRYRAFAA